MKHWKQHIGIVGTEAKINQEELVKIRRKIWSVPIVVLALALMLVGGIVATGVIQAFGDAPKMVTQIPDKNIVIGADLAGSTDVIINFADADGPDVDGPDDGDAVDADPAFTDIGTADGATNEDPLAYTVLTYNYKVAFVELVTEPDDTFLGRWWDSLGAGVDAENAPLVDTDCSKRAARLGFTAGTALTPAQLALQTAPNPHRAGRAAVGNAVAIAATGLCGDYNIASGGGVNLTEDSDLTANVNELLSGANAIEQAFHWDMLSGAEMATAAVSAKFSGNYAQTFAALTPAQRVNVETLYTTLNILARGSGNLTLDNLGIGDRDPATPDGEAGETTIRVKVSDDSGRLIPPGDGANTVGQSFKVTAVLANAPPVPNLAGLTTENTDGTDTDFSNNVFGPPEDSGNDVRYTPAAPAADGNPAVEAKLDVKVSPGQTKILDINLFPGDDNVNEPDPHQQEINFSLTNGGNPFRVKKSAGGADTAQIVLGSGESLDSAGTQSFSLVVNEFGRAPENSSDLDINVIVVIDNQAPTFGDAPPESGTVPERAKEYPIETFSASDPNNQVLTFGLVNDDAPDALFKSLDIDEDTGELTTTDKDDSVEDDPLTTTVDETAPDQPDFVETPVDDPETTDDESDVETDNEHVIVITVTDGTSTVRHSFTLTVTDEDEPIRGAALNFEVDEDQGEGEDNSFGDFQLSGTGEYKITEEIDGAGNRRAGTSSLFGVVSNEDDSSASIFLRREGTIDFEDAEVSNNYTLAVERETGDSNLITIMVEDVNEAPSFGDTYDDDIDEDDGDIKLYVLESAAEGEIIKVGQDAGGNPATTDAQFEATDEDTVDAWDDISYALLHDDDDDDETPMVAYTDLFRVDAAGNVRVNVVELDTDDDEAENLFDLTLRASDPNVAELYDDLVIQINIIDTNVAPQFDGASILRTHGRVSEGLAVGTTVSIVDAINGNVTGEARYRAIDEDGDPVNYRLRDQDDAPFFSILQEMNSDGEPIAVLQTGADLDFETQIQHTVEIQAYDTDGDTDEIVITIDVLNANDNSPTFNATPLMTLSVNENTGRGHLLANYAATDLDGDDVMYSLEGADADSFMISTTGELRTLESLDYDSGTPCDATNGCTVIVVADDMPDAASGAPVTDGRHTGPAKATVVITVAPTEDSVSTLKVRKANPVPGTNKGDPDTALSGTKVTASDKDAEFDGINLPQSPPHERPDGLPATDGDNGPVNFVETEWANWGTVLLIEVTSESPGPATGSGACAYGNQCVVLTIKSDSAGDELRVAAYRSATEEDKFLAAIMLVETQDDASTYALDDDGKEVKTPIYQQCAGWRCR